MAFQSVLSSSRIPMVIILGATGTGKTKLGVELAQQFRTEIISADSMQIYKGLDVVTAKATREEQEAAKHHLIDILEPHQMFTVVDFRNRALKIADNLTSQGKIPIVVGGTVYYLESIVYQILVETTNDTENLLWDRSKRKYDETENGTEDSSAKKLATEKNDKIKTEEDNVESCIEELKEVLSDDYENPIIEETKKTDPIVEIDKEQLQKDIDDHEKFTNEEIHSKLMAVDPVMGKRLHPNNRRKVIRSLEVFLESGKRHSDILDDQKGVEGKLRRPGETLIFWLKCETSVHEKRLDSRVDAMLQQGLIQELLDFHAEHNRKRIQDGKPADYTKGIFQTLGFKEFHDYLIMSDEQRNSEEGKKLLQKSIENMKLGTRRYAKRQNKMIMGRFLNHPNRDVPPVFELDTTDVSKWDQEVKSKAIKIVESMINGTECEYEPVKSTLNEETKKLDVKSNNYCKVCDRTIIGDKEFGFHMTSIKHNKVLKKKQWLAKMAAQENAGIKVDTHCKVCDKTIDGEKQFADHLHSKKHAMLKKKKELLEKYKDKLGAAKKPSATA